METADIDFAVRLTDLEEWGYDRQDFRRFMKMDPEGTFVAWDDSRRVGVTTATSYGKVAWIGSVIVSPEDRGKGYGRSLVERALEYASGEGAETCWLNAYTRTEGFYHSLGFKSAGATIHMEGRAEGALKEDVRLAHAGELEALAAFDRTHFGASRLKVLRELYYDYGTSFLLHRVDDLISYVVGAPYSGGVEVAPWVCDPSRPEGAKTVLLHLAAQHPGVTFGVNVPEENREAMNLLGSLDFEESFRTVRMYHGRGTHGIDPQGIFSLGGLEKG